MSLCITCIRPVSKDNVNELANVLYSDVFTALNHVHGDRILCCRENARFLQRVSLILFRNVSEHSREQTLQSQPKTVTKKTKIFTIKSPDLLIETIMSMGSSTG